MLGAMDVQLNVGAAQTHVGAQLQLIAQISMASSQSLLSS